MPRLTTTARQAIEDQALTLRNSGMTYAQIANELGVYPQIANTYVRRALSRTSRIGQRSFGIEIECKGLTQRAAAQAITAAGITAFDESYNHQARPHWKVVLDGSVSDGCEVVSPILQGEEGLAQVVTVMNALRSAGATVDTSTGMHVHIDARDLTGDEFARVFAFYTERQDLMDLLVAPSRRRNSYCRKYTAQTIEQITRTAKDGGTYSRSGDNKRDAAHECGERYYTVNVMSYLTHGTIEFRQHQGTLNGTKATAWVRMLLAIAAKVQATAEEGISRTDVGEMLDGLGMTAEVTDYLKARATRLA